MNERTRSVKLGYRCRMSQSPTKDTKGIITSVCFHNTHIHNIPHYVPLSTIRSHTSASSSALVSHNLTPDRASDLRPLLTLLTLLTLLHHHSLSRILLVHHGPSLNLSILALLLGLHERAAQAAVALEQVFGAGALEVVLFAQVLLLHGVEDEGDAAVAREEEEEALWVGVLG